MSRGSIARAISPTHQDLAVPERLDLEVLRKQCTRALEREAVYRLFSEVGVVYGKSFQTVKRMWFGPGDVLGELGLAADAVLELEKYTLHPGLLDGALQVAAGIALNGDSNTDGTEDCRSVLNGYKYWRLYPIPLGFTFGVISIPVLRSHWLMIEGSFA